MVRPNRVANQPITFDRQRELIARLSRLAAQRTTQGADAATRDDDRVANARRQIAQLRDQASAEFEKRHAELIAEYKAARAAVFDRYEAEGCRLAQDEEQFQARTAQELADSVA